MKEKIPWEGEFSLRSDLLKGKTNKPPKGRK